MLMLMFLMTHMLMTQERVEHLLRVVGYLALGSHIMHVIEWSIDDHSNINKINQV